MIGPTKEQKVLATLFDILSKIGLVGLVGTFVLYMLNIPAATVSAKQISSFWSLRVGDYLQAVHLGSGWSWIHHLGHSDMLAFAAVAFLCLISAISYAFMVYFFLKKKDRLYALLSTAIVLVLLISASGILSRGH